MAFFVSCFWRRLKTRLQGESARRTRRPLRVKHIFCVCLRDIRALKTKRCTRDTPAPSRKKTPRPTHPPSYAMLLDLKMFALFAGLVAYWFVFKRRSGAVLHTQRAPGCIVVMCVTVAPDAVSAAEKRTPAGVAAPEWVVASANFGVQIKATKLHIQASVDASFDSVIVVEPFVNFEEGGLEYNLAAQMVQQYSRSLARAATHAAGDVPIFAVTAGQGLLKLMPAESWGMVPPLFKPYAGPLPTSAQVVVDAVMMKAKAA